MSIWLAFRVADRDAGWVIHAKDREDAKRIRSERGGVIEFYTPRVGWAKWCGSNEASK